MKIICATGMLLLSMAAAQAKFAPVESVRMSPLPDEVTIAAGPAGAMLESDYFRAPQTPSATSQIFPCRLKLQVFEKTQLAQSCR